jgi:hypothetical protein
VGEVLGGVIELASERETERERESERAPEREGTKNVYCNSAYSLISFRGFKTENNMLNWLGESLGV